MKQLIFVLLLIPTVLMAQEPETDSVRLQSMNFPNESIFVACDSLFNEFGIIGLGSLDGWRFQPGDDPGWADPDFDDSNWMFLKPTGMYEPIPDSLWQGYGWFRFRFAADSLVYEKVTHLYFMTYGAAEVYLDGKLVGKYGSFSTEKEGERRFMHNYKTHPALFLQPAESHVLAVRYSYHKGQTYKKVLGKYARSFGFGIGLATNDFNQIIISDTKMIRQFVSILGTMLFLIVLLYGFLFLLFPVERSNLYITIIVFLLFLQFIITWETLFFELDVLQKVLFRGIPAIFLFLAAISMIPFTITSMFNQKPQKAHMVLIWLSPVIALANIILSGPYLNTIILTVFATVVIFFSSRILIQAWRSKQKGVWYVAISFFGFIASAVASTFYETFSININVGIIVTLIYMAHASVPLGLTAFMASRFRDLYKNLEQKVKERTRELNQSLENLRSTQSQLIQSEKMASLGQLTAGIAHEIQNPLNFVNNFSEVNSELIEEADQEIDKGNISEVKSILNDIKENEQKINHHGKRADAIVKGMLQHSRTSNGHKEPTDINKLADEYLRLSYHGMRAKDKSFNADFKTDFDPNLPKINVVSQDIGRVLLNLINNAFYACTEQSKLFQSSELWKSYQPLVLVTTIKLDDRIQISVKDNGPGIPLEIKDKIFQPFFTTKPTGQGTGLGLSLAYDIVKAHGGEIKVETSEEKETEFIIQLPLN
jgi:signal transduction histidine kinase